jgi:hypothetical protein
VTFEVPTAEFSLKITWEWISRFNKIRSADVEAHENQRNVQLISRISFMYRVLSPTHTSAHFLM